MMAVPGVLHVVLSLNPGGAERLVIEIVRRTRASMPSAVCCLDEPGEWADELLGLGVPVSSLKRLPGFHPGLAGAIAASAKETGARVLHCHQYSPFVYGRLSLLGHPWLRLLYTEHGRRAGEVLSVKRRLVNPLLGRFRGSIVAVSRELAGYLVRSGFPGRRIEVVYNGVDVGPLPDQQSRARARQLLGLPDHAVVVGTVARLDPVKDLATLLTAFARLGDLRLPCFLVIVGAGPERQALEHRAAALGLGARASFTGDRRDVRALLPGFDIFANSSTSEGISITILEAMAAGLPIVATRVGGTPEVVVHGQTGYLVEAGAPEALAEALTYLLNEPSKRAEFGRVGRQRVEQCFTIDRMVAEYLRLYESLGSQEGA
jgi:glycosyltransferase involved in cell wall biosynthesis